MADFDCPGYRADAAGRRAAVVAVRDPCHAGLMVADRTSWSELNPKTRVAVVALGVAQVALAGAAYRDLARRRPKELHGSKTFWRVALLVNWVGPIAYFRYGRRR